MSTLEYRNLLFSPANYILMAAFGAEIVLGMKRGEEFLPSFEKLIAAFLLLQFYRTGLDELFHLGEALERLIENAQTGHGNLKDFILENLKAAQDATWKNSSNTPRSNVSMLYEAFREGVWAVISSATHLIFLMAGFILKVARDAVWEIIYILFPLGISFFPIFPKLFRSFATFAVEVVLWIPLLRIVELATDTVARKYVKTTLDPGFLALTCELIAIILTFSIPAVTHRLVGGALGGDFVGTWTRPVSLVSTHAKSLTGIILIPAFLLLSASTAFADETKKPLVLYQGYVTKIECSGRLLISSIGDENLIVLEAMPEAVGCAVLLKPKGIGTTNLLLETSTGTIRRILVSEPRQKITNDKLIYRLGAE